MLVGIVTACKKDMTAMTSAEYYYNCLIDEDYEAWIDGMLHSETYTDDIRQERIDMLREYLNTENELRGGLKQVKALRDTACDNNAFVFLELSYGDSTCEEILVPMILDGETWKMK